MKLSLLSRVFRILLGRRVPGQVLPPLLQLVLIAAWHNVFMLLACALSVLSELASQFWPLFSAVSGTYSRVSPISLGYEFMFHPAEYGIPMCAEAVLGWVGFRILVRRPHARWRRFIRCWWRMCLWAPVVLGIPAVVAAVLPPDTMVARVAYAAAAMLVLLCALLGPGVIARREVARRVQRIGRFCPVCRYWLRGFEGDTCVECGTPVVPARGGGLKVDRKRPVPLIAAVKLRRRYRWITGGTALICLTVGLSVGIPLQHYYSLALRRNMWDQNQYFMTPQGLAFGEACTRCGSRRARTVFGEIKYVERTRNAWVCPHDWIPDELTRSNWCLSEGDVLLIRSEGHYHAAKITGFGEGRRLRYDWYYQPNPRVGTFTDALTEHGSDHLSGQITFKTVRIPVDGGHIEYDFWYDGVSRRNGNLNDTHYIAFAGPVDIAQIDAADPGWVYKTWEDGLPYEYDVAPANIDLRLSDSDIEVLEFIWNYISPGLTPRSEVELAYLRHALNAHGLWLGADWTALRDDYLAGGRPGTSAVWDNKLGWRIADFGTKGLGRVRGLIVFWRRADLASLAGTPDPSAKDAAAFAASLALIHVGEAYRKLPDNGTNDPVTTCYPVHMRTRNGRLIETVCETTDEWRRGALEFLVFPLARYASLSQGESTLVQLAPRQSEHSWPKIEYDWIAFTDTGLRTCPVCGRPAESVSWSTCPYDGSPYGPVMPNPK